MPRTALLLCWMIAVLVAPAASEAKPGAFDRSFGHRGLAVTALGGSAQASAVAPGPAGTLLVAGTADTGSVGDRKYGPLNADFGIVRYTASGRLDRRFGTGGVTLVDLGADETLGAMTVQPDGGILLAGESKQRSTGNAQLAIVRLTPDGRLDPGFGGGTGYVMAAPAGSRVTAGAIRVGPDGRITVAGSFTGQYIGPLVPLTSALLFVRLLAGGSPDLSLGGDGDWLRPFGDDVPDVVGVDAERGFLVSWLRRDGPGAFQRIVGRFTFDGEADQTYGTDGTWTLPFDPPQVPNALAVQPDGGLLVTTADTDYSVGHRARPRLMRATPAGTLDASFPVRTLPYTPSDRALLALPNGRFVLGEAGGALRRHRPNGATDRTWSPVPLPKAMRLGELTLALHGRRVIAAGAAWHVPKDPYTASTARFAVARFLTR